MSLSILQGPAERYAAPDGLPGLVAQVAHAHPERVACQSESERLLYYELIEQARALAAAVIAGSPRSGAPIALLLPRGPQLCVALLACLMAGRPFLPLSAEEPDERLAAMLATARPAVLVRAGSTGADPAPLRTLPSIELPLERRSSDLDTRPVPYDAGAAAYVLFTSGSTGRPKGVTVNHGAVLNRICWGQGVLRLTAGDTLLQKTPYTFDVALPELLWPLIAGARIVFLAPGAHRDPGAIADAIRVEQVTVCHFVPSMLREFVRWPSASQCRSLRDVLCSGEALTPELARDFARVSGARLHNLYGPTEAAVEVTHWEVPRPLPEGAEVLIGTPAANTTLYVMDRSLRPVPAGEAGELCVAGAQLARGYLGAPAQTRAAFRTLPDGVRVYRTGDRVRVVEGGLEYLGRMDDQVKVRGVRVEPAEVERVLERHPGVAEAAVVARTRARGTELVAFVAAGPLATGADLRGHVRERLPDAFVPAEVRVLDRLPRTSSGKTDRKRLREAAADGPVGAAAVSDELEARWLAALDLPEADRDVGFLDLGGHSLAAARLAGGLIADRGFRVPLAWLVRENLSLRGLRERLAAPPPASDAAPAALVPLSPGQRRLWLLERLHGPLPAYNVVEGRVLPGGVDADRLGAALDAVVRRHPALRTRVVTAGGDAVREVLPDIDRPLAVVAAGTAELERTLADLQWRALPSERAPLFAMVLLRDPAGGRSALALAGNHLVFDQHSIDVLWRELFAACEGRALPPPPAPVAPERPAAERDLDFWRRALDGAPTILHLPFQRPRPQRPTFRGATAVRPLDEAAVRALHACARAAGVSPAALPLTAYADVLARWSGADEVVVGVPTDGRRELHEASTIGFFVDTLPVRVPTVDEPATAAVQRCHARLRDAVAHSGVPFDEIARALGVPRPADRNPVFQAWYNDQSIRDPVCTLLGSPTLPVRPPDPPCLFDVSLAVHPAGAGLELALTVALDAFDPDVAEALADQVAGRLRDLVAEAAGAPRRARPAVHPPPTSRHDGEDARSLAGRFRAIAAEDPGRVAVRSAGGEVTYGELAARADRVAAAAPALAPPGEALGLVAGRVPDLAAAVLGAWASGVPALVLDARLPARDVAAALAEAPARTALWLDTGPPPAGWMPLDRLPDAASPPRPASGGDVCHLLATSGTSGAPKVVHVPSRSFAAALLDHADGIGIGAGDRFVVTSGAGHDPVLRDLLLPLVVGARASIPPPAAFADPVLLWRFLVAERPTILHLTPARAALLSAAAASLGQALESVRAVLVGGDALPRAVAPRLREAFPAAVVCNVYGTTEVPQVASMWRWPGGEAPARPSDAGRVHLPIGTGAGARRLVVAVGAEVGRTGELGEICVLDGLPPARMTGGPLPTRDVGGRPAIRTGDRGRVDLDGEVEWCGRLDRQLSIAGHRVEPDQVELRLLEDAGVEDAVVAPDGPAGQATGLVAFVVLRSPLAGSGAEAREAHLATLAARLRSELPPWAVPNSLRAVDRVVTDRNGKPDAAATASSAAPPDPAPPPDGGVEEALARCVRRHVIRGPLAPETNFFEAGLDSLALLRLHADLRATGFGDLDAVDLFRWPNVRALASALTSRGHIARRPAVSSELTTGERLRNHRRRLRPAAPGGTGEKEGLPWLNRS